MRYIRYFASIRLSFTIQEQMNRLQFIACVTFVAKILLRYSIHIRIFQLLVFYYELILLLKIHEVDLFIIIVHILYADDAGDDLWMEIRNDQRQTQTITINV